MTGRIQNVPTSTNEPSNALGCPYASATETATTVPGNAHGTSTSNDNNRRHPSPKKRDVRLSRRNNVTIQKLHTSAAPAAIADIVKLLKKTSAACGSPNNRR